MLKTSLKNQIHCCFLGLVQVNFLLRCRLTFLYVALFKILSLFCSCSYLSLRYSLFLCGFLSHYFPIARFFIVITFSLFLVDFFFFSTLDSFLLHQFIYHIYFLLLFKLFSLVFLSFSLLTLEH